MRSDRVIIPLEVSFARKVSQKVVLPVGSSGYPMRELAPVRATRDRASIRAWACGQLRRDVGPLGETRGVSPWKRHPRKDLQQALEVFAAHAHTSWATTDGSP